MGTSQSKLNKKIKNVSTQMTGVELRLFNLELMLELSERDSAPPAALSIEAVDHREYEVKNSDPNVIALVVGSYVIAEEIGRGQSGVVYRAWDTATQRAVAVKCVFMKNQQANEAVFYEINVLKRIRAHPHVVKLLDFMCEANTAYMVFDLCTGPIMKVRVSLQPPFPEIQALKYFRQVILALEFLHNYSIIHRDVKPDNILLTPNDQVQLADLGVAILIGEHVESSAGTRAFMAPELFRGTTVGFAEDVWAAGVTLFYLVVGRLPWYSAGIADLTHLIVNTPLKLPSDLTRDLQTLLVQLINKDPLTRPMISEIKTDNWITMNGEIPMPNTMHNCNSQIMDKNAVAHIRYHSNHRRRSDGQLNFVHPRAVKSSEQRLIPRDEHAVADTHARSRSLHV